MTDISRQEYAGLFGPTTGDKIRLGDTDLYLDMFAARSYFSPWAKDGALPLGRNYDVIEAILAALRSRPFGTP